MRLVSTINPKLKIGFLLLFGSLTAAAQENSPFSRYGLGDIFPAQNIVNRGMAGLSAPYLDGQTVNFYNPASYSNNRLVTFDVGVTIDSRTLKSTTPVSKYNSVNFTPSYVAVGMPLNRKKGLGLAFGLRPVSTINYAVEERVRLAGIDSVGRLFEGNGGLYQLYTGIGKQWGNQAKGTSLFSIGINAGYTFGKKETHTRIVFLNDTVTYSLTNSATITSYGQGFINAGFQYKFKISNRSFIRLGATADLKQSLNARQDVVRETFQYDAYGSPVPIDTVFISSGKKGTIEMPATYRAGFLLVTNVNKDVSSPEKSAIGVEFESAKWSQYKFYNQTDQLANSWMLRVGGNFTPDPLSTTSFWSHVNYRGGFYVGRDHVNIAGKELPVVAATFGAGLPVRNWRGFGSTQSTIINTAIEIGKRGNKTNNITESFFRISFGLTLSDFGWFVKRRYD